MGQVIETGWWVPNALERQVSYTGLKSIKDPTTYDAGEPSSLMLSVKSPCCPNRAEEPQLLSGQGSTKRRSLSPHIHVTKAEIPLTKMRHHSCCDIKAWRANLLLIRWSWLVCKDGRAPGQTQGFTFSVLYPMYILRDNKRHFLSADPLIFLAESWQ